MLPFDARFCGNCGSEPAETACHGYCSVCNEIYDENEAFCGIDGNALVRSDRVTAGTGTGTKSTHEVPANGGSMSGSGAVLAVFWTRHQVLCYLALVALCAWGIVFSNSSDGIALLAATLSIPLAVSWPVALARSDWALNFVGRIDGWFSRSTDSLVSSESKMRRWIMFPAAWLGSKWANYANRNPDPFVAASLRVFGYTVTAMAIVCLAIVVVYVVLFLIALALCLWLLETVLGGDSDDDSSRERDYRAAGKLAIDNRKLMVGRRGQEIYKGDGGFFSVDDRVGRVDKDGNIYEGDGGWLSVDKRVGRVDKDGNVYRGDGGWLSVDERVGRIDKDGNVYEGDDGWFSVDERVGKIDGDGQIYEGDGGLFSVDKRTGRSKPDR
jgi:hypothetical protein